VSVGVGFLDVKLYTNLYIKILDGDATISASRPPGVGQDIRKTCPFRGAEP